MKGDVPTLSHFLFWYIILINGTMKEIKLTQGLSTQVDDEDFEYLSQFKWYAAKSRNTFYAQKGRNPIIKMHRLIMKTPDNLQVDHQDHNGLNNQRSNIRNCTIADNNRNCTAHGRCKYLGVCYSSNIINGVKYEYIHASIRINRIPIHLGTFKTEEAAAHAYDKKAKELFGEFANLNFKDS
jgi:hypothetical protein